MLHRRFGIRSLIAVLVAAVVLLAWIGQIRPPTRVEQIQRDGVLRLATRPGPSTYYQTQEGPAGLEYSLAKRFAEHLGVSLRIETKQDIDDLFGLLDAEEVDVIAAGLARTTPHRERFTFSRPYMEVQPKLVYRTGTTPPGGLDRIADGRLEVVAGSSHEALLRSSAGDRDEADWQAMPALTAEGLLYRVWSGRSDFAVTDSNKLLLHQHYYPELRTAADIGKAHGLAWALRREDQALVDAVDAFFAEMERNGSLDTLIERYYGHLDQFDYVGTRVFLRHITERLPPFRELFRDAGAENGVDWRLLAAIGYQESHWNPQAVSPTGVRGLMMLTQVTAAHIGVENRIDPEQSIRGGAAYFDSLRQRIPDRIREPVRTWFALAAYNVGYGHLEDARIITEMRGGDPDSWTDVERNLPLLSEKEWYSRVEHGYARGWEPVRYVENIRKYYELLVRMTEPAQMMAIEDEASPPEPNGLLPELHVPDEALSAF